MADNRTRFSEKEVAEAQKSGALAFVAAAFDTTEENLVTQHKRTKGTLGGDVICTAKGRREAVTRLQALKDKDFETAVEAGFVVFLGNVWGITPKRVAFLRVNGYPEARSQEVPATKSAKFHTHDGRKSHLATATHRG